MSLQLPSSTESPQKSRGSSDPKPRSSARRNFFFVDVNTRPHKTTLLDLPQPLRAKIWGILGFSHTTTLRLVCSTIKEDIDTVVGISSAIDSTFEDFPFHCSVAIRKVAIHELITPAYVEFLKYPLILEDVEIRGEISAQNFKYIIKSCPNITTFSIIFNQFVLDHKTPMFPLPKEIKALKPLSKLDSIKLVATTNKLSEMTYVHKNIMSILQDPDLQNNQFKSLNILVSHRVFSPNLREIMATSLRFLHKHLSTLEFLSLTFRDKDPVVPPSSQPTNTNKQQQPDDKTVPKEGQAKTSIKPNEKQPAIPKEGQSRKPSHPKNNSRGSKSSSANPKRISSDAGKGEGRKSHEKLNPPEDADKPSTPNDNKKKSKGESDLLPGVAITHRVKEVHGDDPSSTAAKTSDDDPDFVPPEGEGEANVLPATQVGPTEEPPGPIRDALTFLSQNPWPIPIRLEQVILAVPLRVLEKLSSMIHSKTRVLLLNLEGYGGTKQNWPVYCEFVKRGNPLYLEYTVFHHINHIDSTGKALPVSLRIFKDAKNLKKLTLLGDKKDDYGNLSRVTHVSSLPNGLEDVIFERLLFNAWQAFRLFYCHPEMNSVTLEYWSPNDRQFSYFMTLLKWVVKMDCTVVRHINLVETKIRFTNERKAVRKLQEAVGVSTRYQDEADTRLLIDTTSNKDSDISGFAPVIAFAKITPPQPKPDRKKTNKPSVDVNLKSASQVTLN